MVFKSLKRQKFFHRQFGASGVAYALLIGLLAVSVLVAVQELGTSTGNIFDLVTGTISDDDGGDNGGGNGDEGGNSPPGITYVEDGAAFAGNSWGPTSFYVYDLDGLVESLTVTATSSNQSIVPDGNITLGGTESERTITIQSIVGQAGQSTITLTVDDGTDTASTSFVFTADDGQYVAAGPSSLAYTSADLTSWTTSNLPGSQTFWDVTWGNGTYVIGGWKNQISTSPDGINWNQQTTGYGGHIYNITYAQGLFVAGRENGYISYSEDGVDWTNVLLPSSPGNMYGPAYHEDNGLFVAVGSKPAISTDGINWTVGSSHGIGTIQGVAASDTNFVIVAFAGAVGTSDDGLNWTPRTSGTSQNINNVTYGNGIYMFANGDGAFRSTDKGVTWTEVSPTSGGYYVDFVEDQFVLMGSNVFTSADGLSWDTHGSTEYGAYAMEYGNSPGSAALVNSAPTITDIDDGGVTVGASYGPASFTISDIETDEASLVLTSYSSDQSVISDGDISFGGSGANRTVSVSTSQTGNAYITVHVSDGDRSDSTTFRVTVTDEAYLLLSSGGVYKTTDMTNWPYHNVPFTSQTIYGGVWSENDSQFVVGGYGSKVGVSPDGENWTQASGVSGHVYNIAYDGTTYVAAAAHSGLYSSTNGLTWTDTLATNPGPTYHIIHSHGKFRAVTTNKTLTSTDGTNWNVISNSGGLPTNGLAYNGTIYVVVGSAGEIQTSPDGITWTTQDGGVSKNLEGVVYADGKFVAVGIDGTIISSEDGVTWDNHSFITNSDFASVHYLNGEFITSGIIYTSDDGETWYNTGHSGGRALLYTGWTPSSAGGGGGSGSDTPPTISDISDATFAQDTTYGPVSFTVSDSETAAELLTVTASSSNQTLVPDGNITLGGSGNTRTITITPAASQTGSATITITVDDGTYSSSDTTDLTVVAPAAACNSGMSAGTECTFGGETVVFITNNDPGSGAEMLLAQPCDQGMAWNGSSCVGSRTAHAWNNGNASGQTNTTATDDNFADGLANTDLIVIDDSDSATTGTQQHLAAQTCRDVGPDWYLPARDELQLVYAARSSGILSGTFETSSSPAYTYLTSSEDSISAAWAVQFDSGSNTSQQKDSELSVRCVRRESTGSGAAGGGDNTAPTISAIPNDTVTEGNTFGPASFTIGDTETSAGSLTVTAVSSNSLLVDPSDITLGGSGTSRTITIDTTNHTEGTVTIAITVDDGNDTTQTTFDLDVVDGTASCSTETIYWSDGSTGGASCSGDTGAVTDEVSATISNSATGYSGSIVAQCDNGEFIEFPDNATCAASAPPPCSGSLSAGTACDQSGETVVFVSNYDPGDGGGLRPLYVAPCDEGMTWNGSSCAGTRLEFDWNDGQDAYTDTSIVDFSDTAKSNGAANTDILVIEDSNADLPGVQTHEAAARCRSKGANWFLPAQNELLGMKENKDEGALAGTFMDGLVSRSGGGSSPVYYEPDSYYWASGEAGEGSGGQAIFFTQSTIPSYGLGVVAHYKDTTTTHRGPAFADKPHHVRCATR